MAEGKILAKISHPRIVRVHEYGSDEEAGVTYFVMDLITNEKGGAARTLADAYADGVDPDQVAVWYEDLREGSKRPYRPGRPCRHNGLRHLPRP